MNKIRITETVKDTNNMLSPKGEQRPIHPEYAGGEADIIVNTVEKYQKILGFGGAFTISAAMALRRVKKKLQEEALNAYFHPEDGLRYTFGRIPMGSNDFCAEPYSCNDVPDDTKMKYFSTPYDRKWLIPMIHDATRMAQKELTLYATPWSPPAWMKSNERMEHGGRLLEQYYPAMAEYFVSFIREYGDVGLPIWGLSVQNEPEEIQEWPSCYYTANEEGAFLSDFLVPALKKNKMEHINVMIWDSNKDRILERTRELFENKKAADSTWGIAFHWYSGDYFENLEKIHEEYPDKFLISTESCAIFPDDLKDWSIGERYGHEIIGDMNHFTSAYIDWNLFLDENGGPNVACNYCAAPIIIDGQKEKITYLSSYYYIGHFSKFIVNGARRIGCQTANKHLKACAVQNPDGKTVVIVMNPSEYLKKPILRIDGSSYLLYLPPHSIVTVQEVMDN